ncbi:MAG: ComEC/Rec2 family competence protein, partial [Rhizobiales bacterium]|nr:ComEC/Rec2 family competence protein [Hyphomicrobiales bacterium]
FLIAILCDRPAITQRNLSIAACLIIFLNPNAVLSPGFQMSFMASVGLVAVFRKGGLVQTFAASNHSLPRKAFAGLASIALTSIVAGAATAPFAIYHFYQTAAFGLLGNLVAMPVVALLIMPAGVVAMLLLPLGLAAAPLLIMEYGLSLVVSVSGWVSSLDGAMLRVGMQSGMVITLLALSILLLCLLRTRLKYVLASAAVTIAIVLSSANTQQPIILIAPNAQMVAINEDGELKILARGKNKFVSRIWLGALADRRELTQVFETSKAASTCTKAACISELNRGQNPPITIIQIKRVEFFEEACRNAESVILISKRDLPEQCPDTTQNPLIIDRSSLQNTGSIAFFPLETNTEPFENDLAKHAATYGFQIQTAHPKIKRPWN